MKTALLLIGILFTNIGISQQEYSNWNVGNRVWLKFPGPVYLDGSQLNSTEGCSSISDATTGDLLFYTNGVTVWDRFHNIMVNGTGLLGGISSSQSAIILKQPGNTNLYYIFAAQELNNSNLSYSIVDINLNCGLGEVIVKNIILHNSTTEKLTTVKHCNNVDWWIITHDKGSNVFRTMLLSSIGISAFTFSNVGYSVNAFNNSSIGCMKVNQQGNRIAVAYYGANLLKLYDFDRATGIVTNEVNLNCLNGPYGLEFSPSGEFLYVGYNNQGVIHQFNLCNNNSRITVGNIGIYTGNLQLQNDGRIYIVKGVTATSLSVIYDPNNLGLACNFVFNVSTSPFVGQNYTFGLSQCFYDLQIYNYMYVPEIDVNCLTATFTIPEYCNDQTIVSVLWDFGDSSPYSNVYNPTYTYANANNYFGNLTINFPCNTITIPFTLSTSVTSINDVNNN